MRPLVSRESKEVKNMFKESQSVREQFYFVKIEVWWMAASI